MAAGSADLLIGRVSAAGNVFALIAPILAGWLSDRTSTRWGRRRPWIVVGTVVNLLGLALLAVTSAPLGFAFAYMLVQLSFNLAGGAYAAVIPDVVPESDRGRASGLLGMMNAFGAVVGLAAVTAAFAVFHQSRTGIIVGYSAIAVIMAITTVITVVAVDEPVPSSHHPALGVSPGVTVAAAAGVIAIAAWIAYLLLDLRSLTWAVAIVGAAAAMVAAVTGWREPAIRGFFTAFRSRDFFWTFATRALVMMGIATIQPWLGLYFKDVLGRPDYTTLAGLWGLTLLAGAILPGVVGGHVSDRIRRRKIFVYVAGIVMGLVASVLLFGLVRNVTLIFVLGAVFGIGYGLYVAVDWALACDVLPDREKSSGRDMGLVAYRVHAATCAGAGVDLQRASFVQCRGPRHSGADHRRLPWLQARVRDRCRLVHPRHVLRQPDQISSLTRKDWTACTMSDAHMRVPALAGSARGRATRAPALEVNRWVRLSAQQGGRRDVVHHAWVQGQTARGREQLARAAGSACSQRLPCPLRRSDSAHSARPLDVHHRRRGGRA
jgi:Na+/melibiose symporter-like transporter